MLNKTISFPPLYAAYVLRFNAYDIDLDYMQRWARQLRVSRELTLVWDEAFPGFAPPQLPPPDEEPS